MDSTFILGLQNLIYVKASEFTQFQNLPDSEIPTQQSIPTYIDENEAATIPAGSIWGYSFSQFKKLKRYTNSNTLEFEKDYVVMYLIGNCKVFEPVNKSCLYRKRSTRRYVTKLGRNRYSMNYNEISKDYFGVSHIVPYDGSNNIYLSINLATQPDILITDTSGFRVLGLASESLVDIQGRLIREYRKAIYDLDIGSMLKYHLMSSYGLHLNVGNFCSIDDIIYDIKMNNGKTIINLTPGLGKVNYSIFVNALIKAGYLDSNHKKESDYNTIAYNVYVTQDQECKMFEFLDREGIRYNKKH